MSAVVVEESSFEEQLAKCQEQIAQFQEEIKTLEVDLKAVETELEEVADEKQRYDLLANISDNLEQLNDIGGSELFWNGLVSEEQITDHLMQLRDKVSFFERRIGKIVNRRDALARDIAKYNDEVDYLFEEIDFIKIREEESKNEYIVEREIRPEPYRVMVMPWTKQGEDEKQYKRILLLALLLGILLGLVIPMWDIPIPDRAEVVEVPERLAKMLKKQKPKPKPKPKQEIPKDEKKKEEKKPTEKERKEAREKVKNKGVLAFKNNFADLLDDMPEDKLGAQASMSNASSTARRSQRKILTSAATSTSGGIRSSSLSRDVAGTGDKIGAVAFSRVDSAIGTAVEEDRPLSDGPGPSRTDEEIQIVFDKYKAALYRIYNRELRSNPTLQGKMVLRITIEPDGSVSKCALETTDLKSDTLSKKIVERVKRFNFGAKDGVPTVTILYPIDFLPSS